jgi:manganese oxidase
MTQSRRTFLAGAGAATAGLITSAKAQDMPQDGGKQGMGMNPLVDRLPRFDPERTPSPAPATMGRQMGRVVTPGLPALGYEMDGKVKVFHLIAQPVEVDLTKGMSAEQMDAALEVPPEYQRFRARPTQPKRMLAWGFNGVCPGPTIEATEGERVRIVLHNELPEPTSIHWHGFELPFSQDGASGYHPFEARKPLLPGQTEQYEFDLIQSGTLMYHTGFNVMKQEGLGLGGLFVVHPRNEPRPPDKDFAILLQQWNFHPGNPNPNINVMEPSFATFNGLTAPDAPMLSVKQGDRVRIRFGNLSLLYHPIHIHGHVFEVVGTTGGPVPESARWKDVTVSIGPGESRDIEFVAWNPGTWRMHCHVLHHLMNQMPDQPMGIAPAEGMFTHLEVKPSDPGYDPRSPDSAWSYPSKEDRV